MMTQKATWTMNQISHAINDTTKDHHTIIDNSHPAPTVPIPVPSAQISLKAIHVLRPHTSKHSLQDHTAPKTLQDINTSRSKQPTRATKEKKNITGPFHIPPSRTSAINKNSNISKNK